MSQPPGLAGHGNLAPTKGKTMEHSIASVATLTAEACKVALVESLERYWVSPDVFSVEDLEIIEGQHMPHEQRVTATCHYTKDTGAECVRQQVEFYWDVWDERIYVDSPV